MNIVNVFTKKQKVIANAHLAANSDYIVYENSILTNCKISRNIFRNLAINQLIISFGGFTKYPKSNVTDIV